MELEILYKDQFYVAINKPHGLLVHRSRIAKDVDEFALQTLRDQINQKVYPCHRLDRKTSGALLFALSEGANKTASELFRDRKIKKTYKAIVRGFTEDEQIINHPLKSEKGNLQEAITSLKTLQRFEIPLSSGKHDTSRYSLLEINPETGRTHQIRRHLAHVFHPILCDRPHGCNKQNKLWLETFNFNTLTLHSESIDLIISERNFSKKITAPLSPQFNWAREFLTKENLLKKSYHE